MSKQSTTTHRGSKTDMTNDEMFRLIVKMTNQTTSHLLDSIFEYIESRFLPIMLTLEANNMCVLKRNEKGDIVAVYHNEPEPSEGEEKK